jgi:hypothetical protein
MPSVSFGFGADTQREADVCRAQGTVVGGEHGEDLLVGLGGVYPVSEDLGQGGRRVGVDGLGRLLA